MSVRVIAYERPVARKDHTCQLCGRTIGEGEQYDRQRIVGDDGPYVFKSCAHCDAVVTLADLDYDREGGYTMNTIDQHEPSSWPEARWIVCWRRRWRRADGSLYAIPSGATS